MSRRWLLSLLCLSAAVVFAQLSSASTALRVDESATRFLIRDQGVVLLEVSNPAAQNLATGLKLELLDPKDAVRALTVRELVLKPGLNKLAIPLAVTSQFNWSDDATLPWYRLRYKIEPAPETKAPPARAAGIISLSEIDTPDIFSLEVSAPRETHRGARHYTHVRAFHPITSQPVKDVNVSVELKLDGGNDGQTLKGSGSTDAAGYALVLLNIPSRVSDHEGDLTVVARRGGFIKEVNKELTLNETSQIMITTDKPIYQPGQSLHVRALVFDSVKRAAANVEATLKITAPDDTSVFQTTLQTSRFGVATADWLIPENTRLGNYEIQFEMDDGDARTSQTVKISRYDLPNFSVNVKPNRSYYLPQQNAEVEVRADYLFGQPVKRGHVRVVREEERKWNFREQKWDIEAGDVYEGETDETGRFIARIDLAEEHKEFAEQDYSRFNDLHFAAYFTDPTTNRTEQRRFDLRVTRDAIHVYIAEGPLRQAHGFPMQFFLATSYADGTPAPCEIVISDPPAETGHAGPVLQTIRTNKYGIAKVVGLKVNKLADEWNPSLNFTAGDSSGLKGRHTETFYVRDFPVIRVETNKALYRPGETIEVRVTASKPEMALVVNVAREGNIIDSRFLSLRDGAAKFTLPYRPGFQDEITISAYAKPPESSDYDFPYGSRTVLFPRDRDLKLDVRFDRADYKPGADAQVDFRITTPEGRPASSALGVVIFDRAVEERARTDQDFNGQFGFYGHYSQWSGYDNQVGGITRKSLQQIDLTKPLPEEMDLIAELLLGAGSVRPYFFESDEFQRRPEEVCAKLTSQDVEPLRDLLETQYKASALYPTNTETLRRLLLEAGDDLDELIDPWGTVYRDVFSVDKDDQGLDVKSAGPDKVFDTKDDFSVIRIARPYFRFTGEAINRAVERFHARSGGFIRDRVTLKSELLAEGIDLDSLRDPWGQPYLINFTTKGDRFNVIVRSAGPNQRFDGEQPSSDDFTLWLASIDYMRESRVLMKNALGQYGRQTNRFPRDDEQLRNAFAAMAIEPERQTDPWGNRYYGVYRVEFKYADQPFIQNISTYGQPVKEQLGVIPVTQRTSLITLRSSGEDGTRGTPDDFDVAHFSQVNLHESSHGEVTNATAPQQTFYACAKGAIKGIVTDPSGGVVAGVTVTAKLNNSAATFETKTDEDGKFLVRNLPVGLYEVRCDSQGFKSAIVTDVPVSSSAITTTNFELYPGAISETVTVTAGADLDQTSTAVASRLVSEGGLRVSIGQQQQLSTPRLREYFPETLVWQPSLETDQQGLAQLKFKLADNITTWKMSVIGSTEDGQLGVAETEFKAFQPFFVEHDPPRVLTEGDQISLPVVLRNYLEREQAVDLEMKPESWFTLQGSAKQRTTVPAGDAARPTFDLKAVASIKDGKQRVTARGSEASDAIEKPVTVHPDGEEKTQTISDLLGESTTLDLRLPASVIPGSKQVELKIYPSLLDHVVESVEGILQQPYGCGEQTISSTYPSLLILRHDKQTGKSSRISVKAKRYLELGYRRLLNYQTPEGGFSYWGRDDADVALTAYALRFLNDARDIVNVEDSVINAAGEWLSRQQRSDGSWSNNSRYSDETLNERRTAVLTAFVVRVLAMTARDEKPVNPAGYQPPTPQQRAFSYLASRIGATEEPYLIASYALAAIDANNMREASRAAATLRSLAHTENGASYWSLETNTPFYGWGRAGRVETTALVVQALARLEKIQAETAVMKAGSTDPLVRTGLVFLLKEKDRYGVWYSTQATINVLDTLMTLLGPASSEQLAVNNPVEVIVNGQLATSLQLTGNQNMAVIQADISRFLQSEINQIQLRRAAGSPFVSVQLVATYYVPWTPTDSPNIAAKSGESSSLRLEATFDKSTADINEEISCRVKAERVGFHGYGMLLAEIGLPPGADVDRASLESAMKTSRWAIDQYDVLPDRVILYLWPRAGGVNFNFKFRPRFALTAKSAPSVVYDYYNPEARALIAPTTFVIR